jgi:phosphoserine aminotransferase
MGRVHIFNAGPACLPLPVLERAQREMLDFEGTGMSIMEHSHRGKAYDAVHNEAVALLRELLRVSDDYHVLFLQGGASLQFAMLPMNFVPSGGSADYVLTGAWSKKALSEAKKLGGARAASDTSVDGKFTRVPKASEIDHGDGARYLHITSNNTIFGTQWHDFPGDGAPLVADMSSDLLWRPIDVSRFAMIYGGAQKNVGPSGVAVVLLNKAFAAEARDDLPNILRYSVHAEKNSLYHTPNTFGVYMMRNALAHLKERGGLEAVERDNRAKADALYGAIDEHGDFYRCPVERESRSTMNVVFNLPSEELEARFVAEATEAGLVGLKGHRSVGGVRASIYNAVGLESVEALVAFMRSFKNAA